MFILSSGNYRKCSAGVSCIIVFAVAIGRAWEGRKESEAIETLMLLERKNSAIWAMEVLNCFIGELPWSCLREFLFWFLSILKRFLTFG